VTAPLPVTGLTSHQLRVACRDLDPALDRALDREQAGDELLGQIPPSPGGSTTLDPWFAGRRCHVELVEAP